MKSLLFFPFLIGLFLFSCSSETKETNSIETEKVEVVIPEIILDAQNGFESIGSKDYGCKNTIECFSDSAKKYADAHFLISKVNAKEYLEKAKGAKYAFISVKNHTLVKITDFEDCVDSGSWGTCMPQGVGFIKRGNMQMEEGYINNIIGKPTGQERYIYLFD